MYYTLFKTKVSFFLNRKMGAHVLSVKYLMQITIFWIEIIKEKHSSNNQRKK